MKVFKNPTKSNSNLIELDDAELKYLTAYIYDLAQCDKVVLPLNYYRVKKFTQFFNELNKIATHTL